MTTPQQPHAPNQPFQQDGEWRSYDSAGRLLRWDERGATWVPLAAEAPTVYQQQAYQQPVWTQAQAVPMAGAYTFASLRTPANWVYGMLAFSAVATIILAIGALMQYQAIGDLLDGSGGFIQNLQAVDDADDTMTTGLVLQGLAQAATAGVFIWWVRRATCNVHAFGAAELPFTPGWAVGWWFIPFANFVQPLRVINQAWRASDPGALRSGDPRAWKMASVPGLLLTWWLVWLISSTVGSAAYNAYDATDNLDSARDACIPIVIGEIGVVVAAVLAFMVVRQLTQRHEIAAQLAAQSGPR